MSDGLYLSTFAMNLYKDIGWNSVDNIRASTIGYYLLTETADRTSSEQELLAYFSGTAAAFELDVRDGTTGMAMFKTTILSYVKLSLV